MNEEIFKTGNVVTDVYDNKWLIYDYSPMVGMALGCDIETHSKHVTLTKDSVKSFTEKHDNIRFLYPKIVAKQIELFNKGEL